MAEHRGVDDVRVHGMHAHLADLTAVAQTDVRPGLACVGRLVHPIAGRRIAADASLAGPHVDHVRVGRGDRDPTDRAGAEVLVGYRIPGHPAVHRLPDAAARRAHVVDVGPIGHAGHGGHPAASVGTDGAPLQGTEQALVIALGLRLTRVERDEQQAEDDTGEGARKSHGRPSRLTPRSEAGHVRLTWLQRGYRSDSVASSPGILPLEAALPILH